MEILFFVLIALGIALGGLFKAARSVANTPLGQAVVGHAIKRLK